MFCVCVLLYIWWVIGLDGGIKSLVRGQVYGVLLERWRRLVYLYMAGHGFKAVMYAA